MTFIIISVFLKNSFTILIISTVGKAKDILGVHWMKVPALSVWTGGSNVQGVTAR